MQKIWMSMIGVLAPLLAVSSAGVRTHQNMSVKCPAGHPRLIVADAQAQAYEVINNTGPFLEAYGCAYGHRPYLLGGVPERLGGPGGGGGVSRETLNGSVVAYEEHAEGNTRTPSSYDQWILVVRDLRSGRFLRRVPTGIPNRPVSPLSVGLGPVAAIVVTRDGAVAWIVEAGDPTEYQVHVVDKSGSRLLASGSGTNPSSLALAGNTLYWMQEGKPMSTLLH